MPPIVMAPLAIAIGGSLLMYAYRCYRYYFDQPRISRDYAAEYNAPILAAPESDKAWPLYVEAMESFEKLLPPNPDNPVDEEFAVSWPFIAPGEPLWVHAEAYIERNQGAMQLLRQGAAKPMFGLVLSDGTPPDLARLGKVKEPLAPSPQPALMAHDFTHLAPVRHFTRVLHADALHAGLHADPARAEADMTALLGLAAQMYRSPVTLDRLTGIAVLGKSTDTIRWLLERNPGFFSDASLAEFGRRYREFGGDRILITAAYDDAEIRDLIQRWFSDDGAGDGQIVAEGQRFMNRTRARTSGDVIDGDLDWWTSLVGPVAAAGLPGRARFTAEWDRLMGIVADEMSTLPWELDHSHIRIEAERVADDPRDEKLFKMLRIPLPAFWKTYSSQENTQQLRDATIVVIALHRYRLETGRFPVALDQLVPRYLDAIPPDRLDGDPLRYALRDKGPILYSVGSDGDDDGGMLPPPEQRLSIGSWRPASSWGMSGDGDWIFWPPPPEE